MGALHFAYAWRDEFSGWLSMDRTLSGIAKPPHNTQFQVVSPPGTIEASPALATLRTFSCGRRYALKPQRPRTRICGSLEQPRPIG